MKNSTQVDVNDLKNINNQKGLPRSYKFNLGIRLVMIVFSLLVVAYALYFMFFKLLAAPDASTFAKAVPIVIIFAGMNTLLQNLFNIHKITLTKSEMITSSLAGVKTNIKWDSITKMSMNKGKKRYITISYLNDKNVEKKYNLMLVFKNMLEILNSIAELTPNAKYDEFLASIMVTKVDKYEKK